MRVTFSFIITLALSLSATLSHAQLLSHTRELIMNTVNGSSDITFAIVATSSQVWEPHGVDEHSTYLTNNPNYVDPDDMTIPGNYQKGDCGWNSDNHPANEGPFLVVAIV